MTAQARTAYKTAAGHSVVPAAGKLPTMYDLPSESPEDGVPDQFHTWQANLLTETFFPPDFARERVMTANDLYLYYDVRNTGYYKRPDWFAAVDVPWLYRDGEPRLSYVVWQEGAVPLIAVELLSPGTENEDLGKTKWKKGRPPTKWEVYERILEIPHYAVFDRYTDSFRAFELRNRKYREIGMPEDRLWLPKIRLGMGLWQGSYSGLDRLWLRWYDADGNWIPTLVERAEEQAQKEKSRAEKEKRQKEKLLAQLKALGIEPDV